LFHLQYLPDDEMKAIKMAEHYDWKNKDTLSAIIAYVLRTRPLYMRNEMDSVMEIEKEARELYLKHGYPERAGEVIISTINILIERGEYDEAKKYMQIYERESGRFDQNGNLIVGSAYYYEKGCYYLAYDKIDSALTCFYNMRDKYYEESRYKGLMSAYEKKHIPDSIAKYARLFADANDSSYLHVNQERVHQVSAMYNYNRQQILATQKSIEAERYRNSLYVLLCIAVLALVGLYLWVKQRKRKSMEEMASINSRYADALSRYNQLQQDLALSDRNHELYRQSKEEELERLRTVLSAYQDDESRPEGWDIEGVVQSAPVVSRLHMLASRAITPSEAEWEELRRLLKDRLPAFYEHIHDGRYALTEHERKASMLIRLRFIPSELVVLLGLSKQRVTNIRSSINRKVFHKKGTKMLDAHIRSL
ncbi:MAG: hypothetical protein IKX24_10120, partial [Prevotella sp.]|nr:hypothetical protein [Prevotella sp.]